MIETRTTWRDSGYDCDHCGGEIHERTDYETGQPKSVCYQCRRCGCQWSLGGDVLRVGNGRYCQAAQIKRSNPMSDGFTLPAWLVIVLAVLTLLILVRFGGLVALRYLIPVAIAALVVFSLVRLGREQEWW